MKDITTVDSPTPDEPTPLPSFEECRRRLCEHPDGRYAQTILRLLEQGTPFNALEERAEDLHLAEAVMALKDCFGGDPMAEMAEYAEYLSSGGNEGQPNVGLAGLA